MTYNKKLARPFRRKPTEAEIRLWFLLRGQQLQGFKFRRQHPIDSFVADFACVEYRLIVEADGGQHAENEHDLKRTKMLEDKGWKVIRFWNHEILCNTDAVVETILAKLEGRL